MHLPRFRLRTLLIAVAVAGTALGGWRMWEKRAGYLRRARAYGRLERSTLAVEQIFLRGEIELEFPSAIDAEMLEAKGSPEESKQYVDRLRAAEDWLAAMRRKYERAARCPWLPVPPGPPLPPDSRHAYPWLSMPGERE